MTPAMRQVRADRDWACRVSGEDPYGHFLPFGRPGRDLDPAALAFRQATIEQLHDAFYA